MILEGRICQGKRTDVGHHDATHGEQADEAPVLHRRKDRFVAAQELLVATDTFTRVRIEAVGSETFVPVIPVLLALIRISKNQDVRTAARRRDALLLLTTEEGMNFSPTQRRTDRDGPGC